MKTYEIVPLHPENTKFAVCDFYKDGTIFPVRFNVTYEIAYICKSWMEIGQGAFNEWRIISMEELCQYLKEDKVNLDCFTKEAQEQKRAEILALNK